MNKNSQKRAWQRMLSGRRLDLLAPSPMDIDINDIARGLACGPVERPNHWRTRFFGSRTFTHGCRYLCRYSADHCAGVRTDGAVA